MLCFFKKKKKKNFFACVGSALLCRLFFGCSDQEPVSSCGAWAAHCGAFSCCGAQPLGCEGFSSASMCSVVVAPSWF